MMSTTVRELVQDATGHSEYRLFNFDFSLFPEIAGGQTIASVLQITVDPTGQLVLGTPVISGAFVQVEISGGVIGTTYRLWCEVTTSGGSKLICRGLLLIASLP